MLDLTKPVQTRTGVKARIICTDREGTMPVVALLGSVAGEVAGYYHLDGRSGPLLDSFNDLVNIPEKRKMTIWVNVYAAKGIGRWDEVHTRKSDADAKATPSRIKCIPVEIEYEV